MEQLVIVGINLARNMLQLHATTNSGKVLFNKKIVRKKLLETVASY